MKNYMSLGNNDYSILGEKEKENKYEFDYKKEDYDINNKCDSHAALVRNVENNSKVLDVGCSTGKLGMILKDFKNCTVDGIEYEKVAYELLKKNRYYNAVYNFSILDNKCKDFTKLKNQKEKYDYIIFGDVLEHLSEPWNAILNACELLKKDGKILVSIPNIAHIDIIKGLINEDFNYKELGLLDNTHIRFFTEKSFVDMIKNLNRNYDYNLSVKLSDKVLIRPKYLDELDFSEINEINENLEKYFVLQNIFEITKVKNKKSIRYKFNKDDKDYFTEISKFIIEQNRELQNIKNELEMRKRDIFDKDVHINNLNQKIEDQINNYKEISDNYQKIYNAYNNLNEQYLKIINSKGWKYLEKLRKIKRKIIKNNNRGDTIEKRKCHRS